MTLTETLQIKEQYLQLLDLRAMEHCEKRWQQEGRPTDKWEMFNFIEKMLLELQGNGIGYPKILLRRKKQIQRGEFTLPSPVRAAHAGEPQSAGDNVCPECGGLGFFVVQGGKGTLCQPCLGRGFMKNAARN